MKSLIFLILILIGRSEDPKYIIINDILYKIPESEIANIKTINNIQAKDITTFKFNKDSCFLSEIELIKVPNINAQKNDPYIRFRVKTTPLFILDDKFVNIEYIYQTDIQSIEPLHFDQAISKYGCKGLSAIFNIVLKKGKSVQSKPVDKPITIGFESTPVQQKIEKNDHFTIIGNTKGFKDSTMLYLKSSRSGSLKDNLDSSIVINNSFTFKGSVSKPEPYMIHTGYTGWQGQPPVSFHSITFYVNNATIHLKDEIGNLMFAKLSGSELQDDQNDFNELRKPLLIKLDSSRKISTSSSRYKVIQEEVKALHEADPQNLSIFIENHPKSIISVDILNSYKTTYGLERTKQLFNLLDPKIRNSTNGKSIEEFLKLPYTIANADFIDLELQNLNGQFIKLSSLKGKYVLLEFWASWCGPCRAENPRLLNIYNQYKQKGFEIYGVSLDSKRKDWQDAVIKDKITWITVSDLSGSENSQAAMKYEVTGIPMSFLIDKTGKIIAKDIRGEALANKLKEIFNSQ